MALPAPSSAATAPAGSASAVVPSDTENLAHVSRGLFIGVGGDVAVLMGNDTAPVVFKNVSSGQLLPLRATKILATGTTATNILALR